MRHLITIIIALCALQAAAAATISGTTYTHELEVARFSLLSIDTAPPQRILLQEGTYNITVPRGTYNVTVSYSDKGQAYLDELVITVNDEGTYSYDFILFPTEANITTFLPDIDDVFIPETVQRDIGAWPAVLLLVVLVILALTLSRRKWWTRAGIKTTTAETITEETTPAELPADLESVVAVIKEEGGRTTQKELRKRIPCSEAKMSMMLTELEAKGRIERIKKGRGNLIVLK